MEASRGGQFYPKLPDLNKNMIELEINSILSLRFENETVLIRFSILPTEQKIYLAIFYYYYFFVISQ